MTTATVTRLGQRWFLRLMPLLFPIRIAKESATLRAVRRAREIANAETLRIDQDETSQEIGFVRLVLVKATWGRTRTWTVDIRHSVHFRDLWKPIPDLTRAKHVRFQFVGLRENADPKKAGSYLEIVS